MEAFDLVGKIALISAGAVITFAYGLVLLYGAYKRYGDVVIGWLMIILVIVYPSSVVLFSREHGWRVPVFIGYVLPISLIVVAYWLTLAGVRRHQAMTFESAPRRKV